MRAPTALPTGGRLFGVELLERDGSLADLDALLEEARGGSGVIALVHGETGIGKTSLVRAFVEGVATDAFVLTGVCDDLFTPRPLGPVWDMADDEPSLRDPLENDDRNGVFGNLLGLFTRSLRPTIAVIEDIHWADEASLDLIRFLGRRIADTHALMILTYRDEPSLMEGLAGLLADLSHDRLTHVPLGPLSLEAVQELAGDELDAASIWDVSGGNPFFVSELVTRGGAGIPASVVDVTRARVRGLSRVARELVELASVVPGRMESALIDGVDPSLWTGAAEAEREGVLEVVGDVLTFRHELVREAVEADLPRSRQIELNRAVLAVLEKIGSDPSRLAHHAVGAGDHEAMLRILPPAARSAADVGSHREAVSLLRASKPCVNAMPDDEQADYYDLLAVEEHLTYGSGENAIQRSIEIRRVLGEPEALGQSILYASLLAHLGNDRATATKLIDEAISVLRPVGGEPLAKAYAHASRLAMQQDDFQQTIKFAELALATADGLGAARASAMTSLGVVRASTGYPDGIDLIEQGYQTARMTDAHTEPRSAAANAVNMCLQWRDVPNAERWLALSWDLAEMLDLGPFLLYVRFSRAELAALRCAWREAESEARLVSQDPRTPESARTFTLSLLARVLARTGQPGIKADLRRAWEYAKTANEPQHIFRAGAAIAEHRWLGGVTDDEMFDEVVYEFHRWLEVARPWHVGELALWLWLDGNIPSIPDNVPDVLRALGRGDWQAAARWFAEHDDRYLQAVALSVGDSGARVRALELLERINAIPLADKLRAELRAEGVHVPGRRALATRESRHGLTARQTEVLDLLRNELSNAEIGQRLFISERTVEHHVSAILTKLGVASRTEAVSVTRRA